MTHTLSKRVDKIITRNICNINKSCFEHEIENIEAIELSLDKKVLVHGDLYCRHLLFNQKKLTGIIDWGDMGINTPAVDLAVIFSFYPSSCHNTFLDIYGAIEPPAWAYARFLGLYSALTSMLYGHDVGDHQLVSEKIYAVKQINSELLISSDK